VSDGKADLRYLIDSYLDWTASEPIRVIEGRSVDLYSVATAPWPRLGDGCRAAFAHLRGRGDFLGVQIIEIPPGAQTDWLRHLYDEVFYVLAGQGSTSIEPSADEPRTFSWGPRALFAPPLNASFRLMNPGRAPGRLLCGNGLPFLMNVFRNEHFLFDHPVDFPRRLVGPAGPGALVPVAPGRHLWEAGFVPDLGTLPLPEWDARGAGFRNINIVLSDRSMHAHVSEIPQPVRAAAQLPLPHLQCVGHRADPARFREQHAHPDEPLARRRFPVRSTVRLPGARRPARLLCGRGRNDRDPPGSQSVGDELRPRSRCFELKPWEARGVGSSNIQLLMSEGSMGAHVSEMRVGTYKKAHRHGAGLHVFFIHGTGYTLLWNEGDRDFQRVDWRHGMCFAPPDNMFHQHFDTSARAARYVAIGFGSKRYPIIHDRRIGSEGKRTDVSIKDGEAQVEYADQDPRIHALWLAELRKTGVKSHMGAVFDESQTVAHQEA
jgi:mannose-6-phosphate isomerase-like protein (cupin superfamily)